MGAITGRGLLGGSVGNSGDNDQDAVAQIIKDELANAKSPADAIKSGLARLNIEGKMMVFFGFQGTLANTYSLIDETDQEDIKLRAFALDDTVSPIFMDLVEFYTFLMKYNVPEGTINPVKIEDAMATLRLGEKMNRKDEKFEDSEVDEFDDNCNEDCIPGGHSCGK